MDTAAICSVLETFHQRIERLEGKRALNSMTLDLEMVLLRNVYTSNDPAFHPFAVGRSPVQLHPPALSVPGYTDLGFDTSAHPIIAVDIPGPARQYVQRMYVRITPGKQFAEQGRLGIRYMPVSPPDMHASPANAFSEAIRCTSTVEVVSKIQEVLFPAPSP